MEPKDFLGNAIQVHDQIVYPVRMGSDLWLAKARVTEINYVDGTGIILTVLKDNNRITKVTKLERVVVV